MATAEPFLPIAALLAELEALSRGNPDRVLRLRGRLPRDPAGPELPAGAAPGDRFELLIFRGFSSLTTHPTAFDPDRSALPEGTELATAELLQAPLDPIAERVLVGPAEVARFLDAAAWRG